MGRAVSAGLRQHWGLDPDITFLNHGSFGATPLEVLRCQDEFRAQMESEPVRFFVREVPELWSDAVARGAAFVGADPGGFAWIANATTGVNTVLASLDLQPGDELLVTNHEYGACRNALDRRAAATGATVRCVDVPFPVTSAAQVVQAVASGITDATRLLLIDHVTSATGLVLPIAEIAATCRDAGVEILVDGAHACGMLDLDIDALGVDYYTGNFHKWVCTPKGVAMLWIAPRHRDRVRPLTTSHGASMPAATPEEALRNEFDWVGTTDPTAVLSVPFTIDYMASLIDGGWDGIRRHNHDLVVQGRRMLCEALDEVELAPAEMLGSLAAVRLPDGDPNAGPVPPYLDPHHNILLTDHNIEIPIGPFPAPPKRLLRLSAQLYNTQEDVQRLVEALHVVLS